MQVVDVSMPGNDVNRRHVIVQADSMTSAGNPDAVKLALAAAARDGLANPRYRDTLQITPVDADGVCDEELISGARTGVVGYQATIVAAGGL